MKIEPYELPDVYLLTPAIYQDHRGIFFESHRAAELIRSTGGASISLVQGNVSMSVPWTVRGLHYQVDDPQGKLVRCIRGAIYDVAVDIRKSSPHYGRWCGRVLDDMNHEALWVPPGFAHGFMAFGQGATVIYECSSYYNDAKARAIRWNDPTLGIRWPVDPKQAPVLSNKDRAAPILAEMEAVL